MKVWLSILFSLILLAGCGGTQEAVQQETDSVMVDIDDLIIESTTQLEQQVSKELIGEIIIGDGLTFETPWEDLPAWQRRIDSTNKAQIDSMSQDHMDWIDSLLTTP